MFCLFNLSFLISVKKIINTTLNLKINITTKANRHFSITHTNLIKDRKYSADTYIQQTNIILLWQLICFLLLQMGHTRRFHHHTPPARSQSQTLHRKHWSPGSGGQRAGQGETRVCLSVHRWGYIKLPLHSICTTCSIIGWCCGNRCFTHSVWTVMCVHMCLYVCEGKVSYRRGNL